MEEKEIIKKLKNCKTIKELKIFGKETVYELTDEEAKHFLEQIMISGELRDEELNSVSGGGCTRWRRGSAYSGNPPHELIVTGLNSCRLYIKPYNPLPGKPGTCQNCGNFRYYRNNPTRYCRVRKWDNDPINPK